MYVSKTIRKINFSYVPYVKILIKSLRKKYVHVNVSNTPIKRGNNLIIQSNIESNIPTIPS